MLRDLISAVRRLQSVWRGGCELAGVRRRTRRLQQGETPASRGNAPVRRKVKGVIKIWIVVSVGLLLLLLGLLWPAARGLVGHLCFFFLVSV